MTSPSVARLFNLRPVGAARAARRLACAMTLALASSATLSAAEFPKAKNLALELSFDAPRANVTTFTAPGDVAGDLFTAPGGGVSGRASDRALDNSLSTGMGGSAKAPGNGGRAVVADGGRVFDNATSFTIQGWYRSDAGLVPGNYARLLSSHRASVLFDSSEGRGLVLSTDKGSVLCQDAAVRKAGQWIFFAITHDSTLAADNVHIYAGSDREAVRLVGTGTLKQGALRTASAANSALIIGNVAEGNRPFDGLIDNIRIWTSSAGAEAVLDQAQLEALRKSDAP